MAKNYSKQGDINLKILDKADNFTNWMYEQIKPYLQGNILEIGSGRGTYSNKIIRDFKNNNIFLSDIDIKYVNKLKTKYKDNSNISVCKIDITSKKDLSKINGSVNSVFALNVLEHINNDVLAMNNIYDKLSKNGKFIILVPAHKFLYNCIDKKVGHYRRYTKKEMIEKIRKTKFKIKKIFYFNFLSVFAWYINGNIFKKEKINENAMGFYNKLVPLMKLFEKNILRNSLGVSLIVVLEK
ncbi:MAG: class I SAM-dependent methyltransferase [archaeon]